MPFGKKYILEGRTLKPKIVKLGSITADGKTIPVGSECRGKFIAFGDTTPGNELEWVQDGDTLVATCCVSTQVSWEDLNRQGYIFGRPVWIDRRPYFCRSLKLGVRKGDPNEWDDLLDRYGKLDKLWHWKGQRFWGQEITTPPGDHRLRGGRTAREWFSFYGTIAGFEDIPFGFRPLLEPLADSTLLTEDDLGKQIVVYGPDGMSIKGTLAGLDDYDLMLDLDFHLHIRCDWAVRKRKTVTISRSAVCLKP